ncbi:glycosyltransferase [Streptomyces sp. NBC_01237]|uniref:glycosyltransferase n=1 Tax=Streptomyces sp. NBC_01237 TaxID=2903790 RepID=UPI002DDC364B|nr:glycosyltransferase [Streptomyces sp. NBC_01237]WRZ76542.1 glycosyltransferase [Streptomyces sp. NBC_01237]
MSKRILLTVQPVESHVRAISEVARLLENQGHAVRIAAPQEFGQRLMRTYGFSHVPAGIDWAADPIVGDLLSSVLVNSGNKKFVDTLLTEYLAGPSALRMARDVIGIIDEWRPNLILRDCTELGGYLAAIKCNIPQVSLDNGFIRLMTTNRESLLPALGKFRAELGIADSEPSRASGTVLTPAPPELLLHDLPDISVQAYRHENSRRLGERLPAWMAKIPTDRPLIYVSLGSIITCASGLSEVAVEWYRRIIAALSRIHCNAVVSVGRKNVGRFDAPPHITVTAFAPQPLLLQAGVALFITHGGFGSLKESLNANVPMAIAPICSDQPDNARRCEELNMSLTLEPTDTPDEIETTVRKMLSDQSFRENTIAWQRKALALPPLGSVLDRILSCC